MSAAPPEFVVQVREGRVEVCSKVATAVPVVAMGPGTALAIDAASGRRRELAVPPDTIAEWTSGQVYFKHQPLAQVAAELARYLALAAMIFPACRWIASSRALIFPTRIWSRPRRAGP